MAAPLIETVNLKKYFNTPRGLLHAVDDVNIKINAGETLGIVGESGCGKSTLGRTMMRLVDATDGKVLFKGENILDYNKKQMKKMHTSMQMIFQDPFTSLNPRLSIGEIISEPMKVVHNVKGSDMKTRVQELMDMCGLPQRYYNTYPHELDGGRRQRVGLARALALDPQFIVCDEPVSALDVSIQAQIINLLMDLQAQKGLAYMFITHDLCVVRHISNNIAVMYLGKMMEIADADELNANPIHPYTLSLLSAVPIPDPETARKSHRIVLEGDVPSPLKMPTGCPFRTRCKYATEKCGQEMPQLTDRGNGHMVACWNK